MRCVRSLAAATVSFVAACTDPVGPMPGAARLATEPPATAAELFARYVALGTSNSQGVQSAGITASFQRSAWPARLATRAGAPMTLPLVQDPGCNPPMQPPLAANAAVLAAFTAFGAGDDFIGWVSTFCAPLQAGIVAPTNNVAVSGADVHDAIYSSFESMSAVGARAAPVYARTLGAGFSPPQTQVSAMLAQQPTFVSVELAANDVLPASTGRIAAMTPYASWQADYDSVITAVQSTGARAVLVGLPNDAARFPSIVRAPDFARQWPYLLTLGISVSLNCFYSSNHLFLPGYLPTLLQRTPTTATCKDVAGAVDYVLTSSDIAAINARMAAINTHIKAKAAASGYAYFALSALYDLPKPQLDLYKVLFSDTPFGPNMSLDGVHPNGQGQRILSDAAAAAISATYAVPIP